LHVSSFLSITIHVIRLLSIFFQYSSQHNSMMPADQKTSEQAQEFLAQTGENFYISSMDTENYCSPCFLHRLPVLARLLLRLAR
jgi:hypothetical protein